MTYENNEEEQLFTNFEKLLKQNCPDGKALCASFENQAIQKGERIIHDKKIQHIQHRT